jgi:glycine C-acetyltransferase
MDGTIAQLDKICDLADKYKALVMIDDVMLRFYGKNGKGTHEHRNVMGRIDIITGTLGKRWAVRQADLFRAEKKLIEMLRQRSRPYLFLIIR